MDVTGNLLVDLTLIGIVSGCYLLFRGFRAVRTVPDLDERACRALTGSEKLKIAEALAYALLGVFIEALSFSNAVFAQGLVWTAVRGL